MKKNKLAGLICTSDEELFAGEPVTRIEVVIPPKPVESKQTTKKPKPKPKSAWEKFRGAWNGKSVEDWITTTSKECKTFGTQFKNALKRELADYGFETVDFSTGHYDVSGFVKRGDMFVYVSYDIPRYNKEIDFDAHEWAGPVLYRTAENEKDYHGGHNNFCSLAELPKCIVELVSATEARESTRLSA